MDRPRGNLLCFSAFVIALATACTQPGTTPRAEPSTATEQQERPNVLIIVTDDQPIRTLDVMPQTRRYFVDEGTNFTHAYSTTPACCPARASTMTGRYAHNHRVLSNEDAYDLDQDTTLQAHLRPAGYRTGLVGKFLNLWKDVPPHFDRWALKHGSRRKRFFDTKWEVDGADKRLIPGYWTKPFLRYTGNFLADWEEDDDEPWFLWLAISAPHAPYLPAPAEEGAAVPAWEPIPSIPELDKSDKPPYVRAADASPKVAMHVRDQQLRSLMSTDKVVDDVMEMLADNGEQDTLAFFLSDNGYLWSHHGLLGTFLSKGTPYTESVTVPMMMRWPGRVPENTTDARLVGLLDIAPTVYDATGVDAPANLDGRSLLDDWERDRILNEFWQKDVSHRSTVPDWSALRTRRFVYVEYTEGRRIVFREYYDLKEDPFELDNLLGDDDPTNDPDVKALHRQLERDRRCKGEMCP